MQVKVTKRKPTRSHHAHAITIRLKLKEAPEKTGETTKKEGEGLGIVEERGAMLREEACRILSKLSEEEVRLVLIFAAGLGRIDT